MKTLTVEEMKTVTGGKTYYKSWKCPYCSMHGRESGATQAIADAKAASKKAYHMYNMHNM